MKTVLGVCCLAALAAVPAGAQTPTAPTWEPFFAGWETEPAMDFGGRTLSSVQSLVSRSFSSLPHVDQHPAVAPAWELPVAAFLTVVEHEVDGHGGRARELGLHPSYAFGWDFSGGTSIDRAPTTHEESTLLPAGGAESDGVLAHRILADALRREGTDGAKIPMAFMGKLDLTLYIAQTHNPASDPSKFVRDYHDGNDMAIYLVARQAARRGVPPQLVWNETYVPNTSERTLRRTWDNLRVTALWNALDPSLVGAVYAYFRDHVIGGQPRVHTPALRVADGLSLTLGTRGALGPQSVSRYLDLYGITGFGVLDLYVRDLDSTGDRAWGFGGGVRGVALGPNVALALEADSWREPAAREGIYDNDRSWNLTGELDATLGGRWGLAAKVGSKSKGFLPGRPADDGVYAGFGVTAAW